MGQAVGNDGNTEGRAEGTTLGGGLGLNVGHVVGDRLGSRVEPRLDGWMVRCMEGRQVGVLVVTKKGLRDVLGNADGRTEGRDI